MDDENVNCMPKFIQIGDFQPQFSTLGRNFSRQAKIGGHCLPPPWHHLSNKTIYEVQSNWSV